MRKSHNTVLCLVFFLRAFGTSIAAERQFERVQAEFPLAMSRLESFYGEVRGKCRWVQSVSGGETIRWQVSFAADHGYRKASILGTENSKTDRRPAEQIYVTGPNAAFSLAAGRDNSYLLTNIGPPSSDNAQLNIGKNLNNNAIFAPCGIWGYSMSQLLSDPSFQIVSAEAVVGKRQKLIKIGFNSDHSYVKSGSIWTAPDDCWAIQKVECLVLVFEGSAKHQLVGEVDYEGSQDGVPILRKVIYTLKPPGAETITFRYDIDEIAHEPTPDDEFTLPFFGLKAPPDLTNKPTRWYLWVALAGLLCLGVAALFRRLSRRAQNASEVPHRE